MNQIDKLNEEKRVYEAKLRQAKHEMKALEAEEKGLYRKERNHRIFTRGGMLEAFLSEPLLLTNDQVHEILTAAFRTPEVNSLLKKMIKDAKEEQYEETL